MRAWKRCTHCNVQKPQDDFPYQNKATGEKHPWCRSCMKVAHEASRQKKLEHYRAVNRDWNSRHKEEVREAKRRYTGRGIVRQGQGREEAAA